VACQMAEALFDDTRVVVEAGENELTATGETVRFAGWKKLFAKEKDEEQVLPEMAIGDKLTKRRFPVSKNSLSRRLGLTMLRSLKSWKREE